MKNIYLLIGVFTAAIAVAADRPNIVHIMVDDLGWQDIASHKIDGKPVYETPHLDRLTLEGRRFTQAYAPAPSCAPSRVSFLRGQHPINTGVYHVMGGRVPRPWHANSKRICPFYPYGLPREEPTIAEVMKKAGYVSGHVGKWHAGGKSAGYPFPLDQGFDFGFTERNGRHKYYNDGELWNPADGKKNQFFGSWSRMKDRLTDFATDVPEDPYQLNEEERPFDKPHDLALGFIRQNKDRPFFLNYCPYYVHGPIQTRDRKRFEHYLKKMGHTFPTDPGPIYNQLPGHSNPYYASMVDTVDWMIGDLIEYLETTDDPRNPGHKLIDNTYVIIDSDNGGVLPYTDNAPLRGGKQNTWEGGVRIPFLVRGPGVPAGSTCDTPINLIDLFPTFMEMAGLEPKPSLKLDGANILPLIHGKSEEAILVDGTVRESLFWYYPWDAHMSATLRRGDWKLVRHYGAWMGGNATEGVLLFRLYEEGKGLGDIGEAVDVGDQFPEVRQALMEELDGLIAQSGAPLPYRNPATLAPDSPEFAAVPAVLGQGSKKDRIWVDYETGRGKSKIVKAQLLYTLNPKPFDSTRGNREEWFSAPAKIRKVFKGRVEARMPPGATHAVLSMVDANGYLIQSETMPAVLDVGHGTHDSEILKDGFAYKPGLFALLRLGEQARKNATKATMDLDAAIAAAKAVCAAGSVSDAQYVEVIRHLRSAIRGQSETPESAHAAINRFPTEPLF